MREICKSGVRIRLKGKLLAPACALIMLVCSLPLTGGSAAAQGLSVLDIQKADSTESAALPSIRGGSISLTNLNTNIDAWYLLKRVKTSGTVEYCHLELAFPEKQHLELDRKGLRVLLEDSTGEHCAVWQLGADSLFSLPASADRPYVGLCDGNVYIRHQTEGRRTRKEWVTDLLRDRVSYGDQITSFIKEKFFQDHYRQVGVGQAQGPSVSDTIEQDRPVRLKTVSNADSITLRAPDLNFNLVPASTDRLRPGRWYPVASYPGIYLSAVTPGLVKTDESWDRNQWVNAVEKEELSALIYLVAFDLSQFDLGFEVGTDHPRVGWSDRIPESMKNPSLPGPEGFETIFPLVRTGKLNPREVGRVAATFAGGFKRTHGAFRWGPLANRNYGSHYGFIVNGVILSKLQPGLATFLVMDDGTIQLRTWTQGDSALVPKVRFARQNGVPLVERDAVSGDVRPGTLVKEWGAGNWSGSESKQLRTLRAGLCIQHNDTSSFLIYAYFTTATPSTMARVIAACKCDYAMHLDMNAPEHTYLAIYRTSDTQFIVQRLVSEMAEVDPPVGGVELPRYVGYADNRDFFYLLRKEGEDDQ